MLHPAANRSLNVCCVQHNKTLKHVLSFNDSTFCSNWKKRWVCSSQLRLHSFLFWCHLSSSSACQSIRTPNNTCSFIVFTGALPVLMNSLTHTSNLPTSGTHLHRTESTLQRKLRVNWSRSSRLCAARICQIWSRVSNENDILEANMMLSCHMAPGDEYECHTELI